MVETLAAPKVFYDRRPRFLQVGPLGYWRVGDEFQYEGVRCRVGSVDWDGMATAWLESYLAELIVREPKRGNTTDAVLESLSGVRTGHPVNDRQKAQCKRIAAAGARQRLDDERV